MDLSVVELTKKLLDGNILGLKKKKIVVKGLLNNIILMLYQCVANVIFFGELISKYIHGLKI